MDFVSELPLWQVTVLAAVSLLVGVLGGFVGLALGTLRLPALLLLGMSPGIAAGTNILVSTLSALVGGFGHVRERRVDWRVVAVMGGPGALGAFLGGFGGSSLAPEGALILVAGVFVFWQSVEFLLRLRQSTYRDSARSPGAIFSPGRGIVEATVGLVVGVVGGAVGLILGSVRLPLIIRVSRLNPRIAAGSNLVIGSLMGAFGFIGHGVQGEVDLVILAAMGLSGMAGTYIGARLTGRASLKTLMLTMSVVLVVVGILLIRDGAARLFA